MHGVSTFHLEISDLKRIHSTNERLSVNNYFQMIVFYITLIYNLNEM
jgi:acetylornithine deacetylase/succinyl-diaminopimelate desuccinylase-like protein